MQTAAPLGGAGGDHQGGPGAQVGNMYIGPDERRSGHIGGAFLAQADVRAHFAQFLHIAKAVAPDVFLDPALPFHGGDGGGEGRLQIGGETGIGLGEDVRAAQTMRGEQGNGMLPDIQVSPHITQRGKQRAQMPRQNTLDRHGAAGGGAGQKVGPGLDHIGNDAVGGAVQMRHAPDTNGSCTAAADVGPAAVEVVAQVGHVRFARRVTQNAFSVGAHRCQYGIDGGADGHQVKADIRPVQGLGRGAYLVFRHKDPGAERGQRLDMLVDGAAAKITAADLPDAPATETPDPRAEEIRGGAHPAGQGIGAPRRRDMARVYPAGGAVDPFDRRAHVFEDPQRQAHVLNIRQIADKGWPVGEQCGDENGKRGVFAAGNRHAAAQRCAAADEDSIHNMPPGRPGDRPSCCFGEGARRALPLLAVYAGNGERCKKPGRHRRPGFLL